MKKQLSAVVLGLTATLFLPCTISSADLIYDSSLGGQSGSGLGAVSTILTIQSKGSTTTESGSVSRSGGADVKSNTGVLTSGGTTGVGDVKTGASQTLTQTLGENGITQASQIAIVFNAAEPSGDSVTLTGLRMSVFNGDTDLFDTNLAAPVTFATTFTGVGKEGLVFKLDAPQATALQTLFNGLTPATVAALHIGLSASASDAQGGPETFSLATIPANAPTITAAPEPGTFLFVGTALAGLSLAAWRRRSRRS